jgi:hypothetical protein
MTKDILPDEQPPVDGQPLAPKQVWRNSRGVTRTIADCAEERYGFVSYVRSPPAEDNIITTTLRSWREWVYTTDARRVV